MIKKLIEIIFRIKKILKRSSRKFGPPFSSKIRIESIRSTRKIETSSESDLLITSNYIYEINLNNLEPITGLNETTDLHKCLLCDKTFERESNRDRHIREFHKKEKHPCPKCKKLYNPTYLYYDHIKRCGITFSCSKCPAIFRIEKV